MAFLDIIVATKGLFKPNTVLSGKQSVTEAHVPNLGAFS